MIFNATDFINIGVAIMLVATIAKERTAECEVEFSFFNLSN